MENGSRPQEGQQPSGGQSPATVTSAYGRPARSNKPLLLAAGAALLLLLLYLFFFRWTRIAGVEIEGLQRYQPEALLALAGIDGSATYFNLNENDIRQRIDSDRYLEFLEMEKEWPDRLYLRVRERTETANFLYMGVQYVLADDGMVLSSTANIALDNGCLQVAGLNVRDIRVGAKVICQDALQLETMQAILTELELQGVLENIAEINLTSMESIYLVSRDGYTANIGNEEELRAKIGTVRAVASELRRRGLQGGTIEATVPGQASYRPPQ